MDANVDHSEQDSEDIKKVTAMKQKRGRALLDRERQAGKKKRKWVVQKGQNLHEHGPI